MTQNAISTMSNRTSSFSFTAICLLICVSISGCGGGGGSGDTVSAGNNGSNNGAVTLHAVSGSVTGLAGSGLVLQNNAGDDLAVSANGTFTFPTSLQSGSNFSVTVLAQPKKRSQTCTVTNGSGTLDNADISTVAVNCVTNTYSVGGTLNGLSPANTIVLQLNGGDNITLSANGALTFPTGIESGTAYAATILTPPTGQPCTSTYNAEVVDSANISNIEIICGPASVGTWSANNSMGSARVSHSTTVLQDGRVLVAGGVGAGLSYLSAAEIFDPSTNTWSATGSMAITRAYHTATLLPNGKVLVAGGVSVTGGLGTTYSSAELYDPVSGTWSAAGSMSIPREFHTATLLPNGKVLVAGGNDGAGYNLASAELYDPDTGTWAATGSMAFRRIYTSATLLPNGKVLLAGGTVAVPYGTAELYDPSTGTWTATGNMTTTRYMHTGTLLPNGKVLIAGGRDDAGTFLSSAELYDPSTGTWATTGSMASIRFWFTSVLLPTGKVLVAGGEDPAFTPLSTSELYDPSAGTWSNSGSMANPRYLFSMTRLQNGKVLVEGAQNGSTFLPVSELYW